MKDLMKLFAQLIASATLFVAIMGVINIVFDTNWGMGRGGSFTPLPKHPVELMLLVLCLMAMAGLFWLAGSASDIFNAIKRKPAHSFGLLAALTALIVIGGNFGLTQLMGGPLQRAVEMGNTQEVVALTQKNSYEPEALSKPLYFALQQGDYAMADVIVTAGADVNYIDDGEFETSILQSSVFHFEADAVEFLLERGADPNVQDNLGRTAMMIAVTYRDGDFPEEDPVSIVKMLHEAGGDLTVAAKDGSTVSAIAQRNNITPIISYLEQLANPSESASAQ